MRTAKEPEGHWWIFSTFLISTFFITLLLTFPHAQSFAQRVGEQAEMNRLEQQADDLSSQQDPEGAAQAIGKAAMMADLLTSESEVVPEREIFHAASLLYRAQELGYRALALFEQTGGAPPAPAGVCHYLIQATQKLNRSMKHLTENPVIPEGDRQSKHVQMVEKNTEWESLLQGLHEDFACPVVSNQ